MTESRYCPGCNWTGLVTEVKSMSGFEFCPSCHEQYIGFTMPKSPKSEIEVGDLVRWKSQANASRLLKVGVVVGVIPAYQHIRMDKLDHTAVPTKRYRRRFSLTSQPMDHVSYVVSVKTGVTDAAKRTLYHPSQEVILAGPEDKDGVWGWNPVDRKWNAG